MDKSCANHPESMALATCKACDKSVCLMCVVDEKEGTFCSSDCHTAFSNGQEVPKFVGAATEAAGAGGVQKLDSIFDDDSSGSPAPAEAALEEVTAPPPEAEPMPIVAEGTKWRPIGAQCENHGDTPAVANCDRCGKPVCALCLLESAQGTFCSTDCMNTVAVQPAASHQPQPSGSAERAALQGRPVYKFRKPPEAPKAGVYVAIVLLVIAAGAGGYYGWNSFVPDPTSPEINRNKNNNTNTNTATNTTAGTNTNTTATTTTTTTTTNNTTNNTTTNNTTTTKNPNTTTNTTTTNPPFIPTKRPKQPRVAIPSRTINPWNDHEVGVWYRTKTTRGSQVTYTDLGLKEKGKDFVLLQTQTSTSGQDSAVTETRKEIPTVYLRGEETFRFEGQPFLCEIQTETTEELAARSWSLLSGKNAGAVLKSESVEGTLTAKRVWEHTMRIKGTPFDCLVIEAQIQSGTSTRPVKNWYCGALPIGLVQQEKDGGSMELIDFGKDWSKRPAFPK
jgi:hypothetical protein